MCTSAAILVKGAYSDVSQITQANIIQGTSGVDSLGEAYTKYTQGPGANTGTVYVVQGNSASVDDAPAFTHPYMVAEYGCDTCAGSFILDVDSNRLDGRHIDMNGNVIDHFTILKTFGPVANETPQSVMEMTVGPNPFANSTVVNFELAEANLTSIRLTDAAGKSMLVFEGQLQQGKQAIAVDGVKLKLAAGVYILEVRAGEQRAARSVQFQ